ncbi:HNH endonuclease [Clostridia bacterium]|nr:HNH endonuclease [Clostridia bacterium]
MPNKPLKPCRSPGCPNLSEEYYCERHRRAKAAEYNQFRRDPELQAFYNGSRWRAMAKRQLKRQPLCGRCLAEGRLSAARIADHIVSIKNGGARYDADNLQSLCVACHNKKTAKE